MNRQHFQILTVYQMSYLLYIRLRLALYDIDWVSLINNSKTLEKSAGFLTHL